MSCAVCYGTSSGLHHGTDGQEVKPDPQLIESMGEQDAVALALVQLRYDRLKDMYTNCTVVDGNLEIVFLIGPGNQTFSLDFLRTIREVTSRRLKKCAVEMCNSHSGQKSGIDCG